MITAGPLGFGPINFRNISDITSNRSKSDDVFDRMRREQDEKKAKNDPAKIAEQQEVTGQPIVLQSGTANTLWQTQSFAQSEQSQAVDAEEVSIADKPSAEEEFLDYMNKPTEDLLREAILKELGLTEEDMNNLDPKERAKIEAKIKELVERKIEEAMREEGYDVEISSVPPAVLASDIQVA